MHTYIYTDTSYLPLFPYLKPKDMFITFRKVVAISPEETSKWLLDDRLFDLHVCMHVRMHVCMHVRIQKTCCHIKAYFNTWSSCPRRMVKLFFKYKHCALVSSNFGFTYSLSLTGIRPLAGLLGSTQCTHLCLHRTNHRLSPRAKRRSHTLEKGLAHRLENRSFVQHSIDHDEHECDPCE